jgi:multiple sugar transport system ATP-binding protein
VTQIDTASANATKSNPVSIRLSGVRKSFGRTEAAVDIATLNIAPGELVTFVGPSGCGKTTTMRMIAGLEDPTDGAIHFGQRRVNEVSVQKRNIAMVFQNYALYPHMKVWQNLEYGLKKRGVPAEQRAGRVKDVAAMLRIEKLLDKRPAHLSGGEQQRVALGRAIIRTPDVLLLDEPLSNLDAKLRTVMRTELVKLQRAVGCTTIFVTHDQLEAMTMSDRIAVMNQGQILQFGTPAEIYEQPSSMFVAGFMGSPSMNFTDGKMARDGGQLVFAAPGLRLALPDAVARNVILPSDGKVTLGARPEHIQLVEGPGDVAVQIAHVELIGAEKHVQIEGPMGVATIRLPADSQAVTGDRFGAVFDLKRVRFFGTTDQASLQRS